MYIYSTCVLHVYNLPLSLPSLPLSFFLSPLPLISSPSLPLTFIFPLPPPQYLMCGLADINVEDWKKNSIFHNGYTGQDQVIVWFWKVRTIPLPPPIPLLPLPPPLSLLPSLFSSLSLLLYLPSPLTSH